MIEKSFYILLLLMPSCRSFESNPGYEETVARSVVEAAIATGNALLVDARPEFQYEVGHIPHAINIPFDNNLLPALIERHALHRHRLILYCSSRHCDAAGLLAVKLRELGCRNITIYPGGWEEWVGVQQ